MKTIYTPFDFKNTMGQCQSAHNKTEEPQEDSKEPSATSESYGDEQPTVVEQPGKCYDDKIKNIYVSKGNAKFTKALGNRASF